MVAFSRPASGSSSPLVGGLVSHFAILLWTGLALIPVCSVRSHSWGEETRRVALNGTLVGPPGYERHHEVRGTIPENDIVWLIPPNGRPDGAVIHTDDKIAKPTQRKLDSSSYSAQFPMLKAAPGDFVTVRYQENGHVTGADNVNPTKPVNRGTVYLYGTTNNDLTDYNLVDIHLNWTADGTGGDGRGRLLATRNYDDGQCHQTLPPGGDTEGIATYRARYYEKAAQDPMGMDLWCQSAVQIPADAPVGKPYTVIWLWDWPDMNKQGAAVPPASFHANTSEYGEYYVTKPEIYTSIQDFDVVDPCDPSIAYYSPSCNKQQQPVRHITNYNEAAVRSQLLNPWLVHVPQAGFKNVTDAAYAPPQNIPFHKLIGIGEKPAFPLASSILDSSHGDGAVTTGGSWNYTGPAPTNGRGSSGTSTTAARAGAATTTTTVTVAVTVPTTVYVEKTVTVAAAANTGGVPTVLPFLGTGGKARAEWAKKKYAPFTA
ncbi:hypothetical protein QBC46DRAFT_306814 [Diplogelasinospora grovesii]|uniref:DUF7492 domain-containing protein n=1 Tax=Diplogelasinospora grovesii TaxID=303347 RepID=A0AAN6S782_9PEZI|nr:hypothetical protein QBC46DRAFT_306814 [Diplogelasinospora grovesii]